MAEHNFSVENTLTLLLDDKKYHSLRDILSTMNPADIAAVFDELPEGKLPLLFRLLPKELAAETFVEMDTDAQALLIRGFSDSELKEVINELYVDDAVDIVEEMPANVVQRILTQADPEMRKQINEIRIYFAKVYLERTSLPLAEISVHSGFSSHNYFARRFKASVGMSPLQYRAQVR